MGTGPAGRWTSHTGHELDGVDLKAGEERASLGRGEGLSSPTRVDLEAVPGGGDPGRRKGVVCGRLRVPLDRVSGPWHI